MSAPDRIRFRLDGRTVEAEGLPPTTTVLQYLRGHLGRSDSKEGCAEGDCGACTVAVGELHGDAIRYRAVNACIRFLPTLDGKELVTAASLAAPDGTLHPVQQALADEHASQCGFCTPGFVMSLFALYMNGRQPQREAVVEALAGNLCRCTGYRPIIDAGCEMTHYPPPRHWSRAEAHSPARIDALQALRRERELTLPGFRAPRTIEAFADALLAEPQSLILAGGTDIGLWVTKQLRELPPLLYIGEVAALQTIRQDADGLDIGAAVSLTDAWQAIVAAYPSLGELAQRFASPPVRNAGTLCGNLANGSPIGDSMPALIAIGAELQLRWGTRTRRRPLEDFYRGYQDRDLSPGEFVERVLIPAPVARRHYGSYKLSKRIDQDISAVCAGFAIELDAGHVVAARIAYGGMAAIPARARRAEAALDGQPWSMATVERAVAALAEDFQPLGDLRASAGYRQLAAGNLLRRFFLAHSPHPPRLRTGEALKP